ncbi:Gfo/Idh/MocA family oxidoreductase [Sphingomonas abietis]|uniref:Gfo/Idh/MocA family oxidoreductase n=1 Tax=Sphingomonas abietis TaxID=3012344 RepID=UPI00389A57EB
MADELRVGIIGANAHSGWARESHVPAVQALAGLSLAAIATNSRDTADEAAKAFGTKGYASGLDLIADPAIDIVTVATRVWVSVKPLPTKSRMARELAPPAP